MRLSSSMARPSARCMRPNPCARAPRLARVCRNSQIVRAGGDSEGLPVGMTVEDAFSVLGLSPASSPGFDEIMSAKNKLKDACGGDQEKIMQVG